jgi:IclR family transcriptional regulator, acetate operon repressor
MATAEVVAGSARLSGGVQSIARAFDLLETMADLGGIVGLSQLASSSGLPLPTIHRLMRTLLDLGYVRQEPSREYALGPRLVRLGESAGRLLGDWATPYLQHVVDAIGESANLAMLDGYQVVYTAQVPGRHSMRMFTEVGRRAGVHCTAVGKAMLAALPADRAGEILRTSGLRAQTPHTITTLKAMEKELDRTRLRGYAIDDEEQEVGVRCVAVTLPGEPSRAAVSISGPTPRMTDTLISTAVPLLTNIAASLADELDLAGATARSKVG